MSPLQPTFHSPSATAVRWLWILGVSSLVFGGRIREVALHAGGAPYLDQWRIEGQQILLPWLQGKLSLTSFFAPHHEHVPAWTRFIAWAQAAGFSRWDPQLQATFNAAFYAGLSGLLAGWLRRSFPLGVALPLTLLVVALGILPFGWENSTWGFQSHVPIAMGLVFLHIAGTFSRPAFSFVWWGAQAAGFAGLFTLGSMWAAPAAVAATLLWTGGGDKRRWVVPALIAVAGLVLLLAVRAQQPPGVAISAVANSPHIFLAAFLLQLGWPADWPGACVLLYLPAFLIALQIRRRTAADPIDKIVVALALWAAAQAVAFAFARGGGYIGFVSRYGDFLSLGVLANGVALGRLLTCGRTWRPALGLLTLAWLGAVIYGLNWISTRGHTEYFHTHSAEWIDVRQKSVRQYLLNKDLGALSSEPVRNLLYPDPAAVATVLDQPGLSALLPIELRPDSRPARGDPVSAAAQRVRAHWKAIGMGGSFLFVLGILGAIRAPRSPSLAPLTLEASEPGRAPLLLAIAVGAGSLLFLWPQPLEFRAEKRWALMLTPLGTIADLSFRIITETNYPKDNLTGGAALWPENLRNTFYGTHIDGPAFSGTAHSSRFPIQTPWLVIPYAGFPVSTGNALGLEIVDANGNTRAVLNCPGPNPTIIGFWAVEVRAFQGQSARMSFTDGRTDAEGWIAAGPPQPAAGPEVAAELTRNWAFESTRSGHDSLSVVALAALIFGLATAFNNRRRRS